MVESGFLAWPERTLVRREEKGSEEGVPRQIPSGFFARLTAHSFPE